MRPTRLRGEIGFSVRKEKGESGKKGKKIESGFGD
jgi:hypothetical protein